MNDQDPKPKSGLWKDIRTPLAAMAGVTALILVVWLGETAPVLIRAFLADAPGLAF